MTKSRTPQIKIGLFIILLIALLGLVFAFATNRFHIGISGSFTYLIYVFLGLISSVVCYGLLSSMGEIQGNKYETTIKLGGAIVGLVVVGGGGMIYEKYVQKSASIDMRVVFYESNFSHAKKITGEATLLIGNKELPVSIRNQSSVLFQGIPSSAEGSPLIISLESDEFEIDSAAFQQLKINPNDPVFVKLRARRLYANPEEAKLDLQFNNGSAVKYVRRPNDKNITIQINAISETNLIIPIAKEANLQVISNSGIPIFSVPLFANQLTFLTDKNLKEIYFDGFVPNDLYEIAKDKTAILTVNYWDMSGKHRQKTWQINFNFTLTE